MTAEEAKRRLKIRGYGAELDTPTGALTVAEKMLKSARLQLDSERRRFNRAEDDVIEAREIVLALMPDVQKQLDELREGLKK